MYYLTLFCKTCKFTNKKGQLSLTNPRDACETFARTVYVRAVGLQAV